MIVQGVDHNPASQCINPCAQVMPLLSPPSWRRYALLFVPAPRCRLR